MRATGRQICRPAGGRAFKTSRPSVRQPVPVVQPEVVLARRHPRVRLGQQLRHDTARHPTQGECGARRPRCAHPHAVQRPTAGAGEQTARGSAPSARSAARGSRGAGGAADREGRVRADPLKLEAREEDPRVRRAGARPRLVRRDQRVASAPGGGRWKPSSFGTACSELLRPWQASSLLRRRSGGAEERPEPDGSRQASRGGAALKQGGRQFPPAAALVHHLAQRVAARVCADDQSSPDA